MTAKEELKKQINVMVEKSVRTLEDAKIALEKNRYETCLSRAYYSVFHILQAVLLIKGLSFSKHSGVIGGFSQHFIKPGIFPKEFAEIISELREDRENGDYSYAVVIDEKKARNDVENAEKIVSVLKDYLIKFFQGGRL